MFPYKTSLIAICLAFFAPPSGAQNSNEPDLFKKFRDEMRPLGIKVSVDERYKIDTFDHAVLDFLSDPNLVEHLSATNQIARILGFTMGISVGGYDVVTFSKEGPNLTIEVDARSDVRTVAHSVRKSLAWASAILQEMVEETLDLNLVGADSKSKKLRLQTPVLSLHTKTVGDPNRERLQLLVKLDHKAHELKFDKLILTDKDVVYDNVFYRRTSSICIDFAAASPDPRLRNNHAKAAAKRRRSVDAFLLGDLSGFKDGFED